MVIKKFIILIQVLFFTTLLYSQQESPNYKTYIAKVGYQDTLIDIGYKFVIQFSDILTLQNKILSPVNDYTFDYRQGIIHLSKDLFKKYELDTFQVYNLKIEYDVFPYNLKDEYSNFDIITERDSVSGDTVQIATQKKDFIGSIFDGTDLEKSGSLFRGVNIGSNRDLSLNSGFRLQLNGKLTDDIEINAALTDETSPIQPEGNTEKLQELDKVFIEIKSNNFIGTIGDINVDFVNTEFMNFKRKIQGAKGFSDYGAGNIFVSGAVQRGLYNTNLFGGTDGIQGPYYLIGRDNEINILILSGTEKVYLDGNLMTRGEQADYTIDYGIGSITFTNNRLITSNSRIIVDFEYTDRKYTRTILSGFNQLKLLKNKFSLSGYYVNQNDNKDKTVDFTLTEQDKEILTNAGDDKFKATKSGVEYVGIDSATGLGRGLYVKSDTVINNTNVIYYKYLPYDSNAVYQVIFSFVGQGVGNYIQQSSFQYDFAGLQQGNFDTIVFIPIPNAYQVGDIKLNYESSPRREFVFNLETALSVTDGNKFSSADDNNNNGVAIFGSLGINKYNFRILGMKMNIFELNVKEKLVNKIFVPLERYNPVEFYREYDIQDTSKLTEDLHEASLRIAPNSFIDIKGIFGQLLRGTSFNSLRTVGEFSLKNDTLNLPDVRYRVDIINADNSLFNTKSRWLRQYGSIGYKKFIGGFSFDNPNVEFRVDYNMENRRNNIVGSQGDSLLTGSLLFNEVRPRLTLNNFYNLNLYTEFGFREDNTPVNGIMLDESNAYTQTYGVKYGGLNWLSTLLEFAFRKKVYTEAFVSDANTNINTLLVNWQTRVEPFSSAIQTDLYYNVSSERQAKIEKVFRQVPVGQGNYIYLGDLNQNGLLDENEFALTAFNDGNYIRINLPTSNLFPVTALNTSARIILKPTRYFTVTGNDFFSELLRNTSTESYARVEEKTGDLNTDNVYFLNFSTFQNDTNSLFGTQLFQQDINFFEFSPAYSLKLRFIQQNTFNQYVSGNERFFTIQKIAKLKIGLTKDLTTIFDYVNKVDRNDAPVNSVRNRNISSDGVYTDFSYRPVDQIESGFQINFIRATDKYPFIPTQADINQQILRFIYSFTLQGRLQIEIERDEVRLNKINFTYPYELTNGRQEGKSILWRALFDYSISKNLQATFNYDGRSEGSRRVIHTGRAEVKAFF
ncbi:MAG: hypothetical protein M3R36_08725 [Bacteroidota bacterium]|nr:hypothetical protein [Bacteroidota bacterium]